VRILCFDPGARWNGWAELVNAQPVKVGVAEGLKELNALLQEYNDEDIDFIICEDYIVRPDVPHSRNRVGTVRSIGLIEGWADIHDIKLIMQYSSQLPAGYGHLGMIYKKKKKHYMDALVHGTIFLRKRGLLTTSKIKFVNS
jgi:hypothetical protein